MLTHMAQRLSSFFISKNIIKEEDREVYDYSFEILLSTLINLGAVIIFAVVSRSVVPTLFFLLGFMAIRTTAGGFHAETHIGCFLILVGSYTIYLLMLVLMSSYILSIIALILCIISWLLVVVFSPVEDYNKPFTKEEYKRFKIVSNTSVVITSIIVYFFIEFLEKEEWGFSIAAGMCVVSLSLIAGNVKNKLRESR